MLRVESVPGGEGVGGVVGERGEGWYRVESEGVKSVEREVGGGSERGRVHVRDVWDAERGVV